MAAERCLVAGLGNPGEEYARTRHNVGFMVIDYLAAQMSLAIDKKKFDVEYNAAEIEGEKVLLAKPMTYMNSSGYPLLNLSRYFNMENGRKIIVHDDIDLAFGQIKIKTHGGHGGHKGIKSIIEVFGRDDFTRIRVGIGHPGDKNGVVGHVLGKFSKDESETLGPLIARAAATVITIIAKGEGEAMNRFHGPSPEGIL
jgi:peptidyl-tRNA hydrolase, PTH1 family